MMEGPVAIVSILGAAGQSHMQPDGSDVEKVIEDLPYLLHVNSEVDVIGTSPFGLKFRWNKWVTCDRGSADHLLIVQRVDRLKCTERRVFTGLPDLSNVSNDVREWDTADAAESSK